MKQENDWNWLESQHETDYDKKWYKERLKDKSDKIKMIEHFKSEYKKDELRNWEIENQIKELLTELGTTTKKIEDKKREIKF